MLPVRALGCSSILRSSAPISKLGSSLSKAVMFVKDCPRGMGLIFDVTLVIAALAVLKRDHGASPRSLLS